MRNLMDKCAIIHLLESGYSRRYVSKELKINRRTVTKYCEEYLKTKEQIALDPTDPCKKESLTAIPTYNSSNRKLRKYTEEINKRIDELLDVDSEKSMKLGSHKQKLTTRSIHEILDSEGFNIAESTITPYVRRKIQKQREAFIKQIYPLGYRAEFDFGEIKCLINGEKRTLYLAVFSSPSTGYRWCKLYNSSNQQVFIDAHIQFFKEF
ncbi:hypothetical protein [Mammaliicoccus sciuri]|uniref:hypothetical protein n=1 Tax=Mammaliicoccus sciuri TaxID=1296 RepID=UPI001C4FFBC7|nr:hypothetical protein [Mammaliicoccus sciuri]